MGKDMERWLGDYLRAAPKDATLPRRMRRCPEGCDAAPKDATLAVRGEATWSTRQIAFAAATVRDGDGNIVSRAPGRFLLYREEPDGSGTSRR